ncbi:MAG TPA: sigma-70 family RNA polymerase sigma factor [Urbifossiella sp.]|jgi:RNA polymerase sigma factor (sigma-70 family)|nr:sigma-70 family RNA polymerase sigma factor [Urbifossiella sp.]
MSYPALSAALGRLARAADPDPPADGRLVARYARNRDPEAFAELVRRLGPMVLGVCRRVTGDAHLADDAFQAAFLVLARRAADVDPAEAVRGWMYGVAVRVARGARSVSTRRRTREVPVPSVPDRAAESAAPPDADALRALDEEVAALPDHVRAAVVLCELDGYSRKDAAGQLGVPEGTVSSRLAAGRKLLAARLRKRGVTAPAAGLAVLVPVAVPPRLFAATSALATGGPASAGAADLAHGVVRVMVLHKLKAVPVALGLLAAAAFAAGPVDVPRPAPAPVRVSADPPAPKAKAAPPVGPGMIVVCRAGTYWRLDPDGKKLDEFHPPREVRFGGGAVVSPDGVWVAIVGSKDEPPQPLVPGQELAPFPLKLVVRRVLDHPAAPKVIDLPGFTLEPHWAPDGKTLVLAQATSNSRTAYEHQLLDAATGATRPLALPTGCRVLDVARDGKTYLVEHRDAGKRTVKLGLAQADGAGVRPLTDLKTPPGFITARFSPDGKRVLFTDGDPARKDAHKWGRSHRPYLLDVATGAREPLADFPDNGQAIGVAWSPDGKRVAYTWDQLHAELLAQDRLNADAAMRGAEAFLIVADADGRNAKTVASDKSPFAGNLSLTQLDWR